MRVYEMTDNPAAREMIGYLLCRGGVHKEAYAKALEDLTGVEMTKLLPIRNTPNDELTEAKKYMDQRCHRTVYRFSPEDYTELGKICNGAQVDTGEEGEVAGGPPERAPIPDLPELPRIRLGCCGGGRSRNRQQDRSELARTSYTTHETGAADAILVSAAPVFYFRSLCRSPALTADIRVRAAVRTRSWVARAEPPIITFTPVGPV